MQEITVALLQQNPIAAPVVFIILRALTVIFPPVPGILVDIYSRFWLV